MKKIVLKLEFYGDRIKQKAMKVASGISGVKSVGVEAEDKKMTIVGEIDAVKAVKKLRKLCRTEIVSVGEDKEDPQEAAAEAEASLCDDIVHGYRCYHHNYYASTPYPYSHRYLN